MEAGQLSREEMLQEGVGMGCWDGLCGDVLEPSGWEDLLWEEDF